MELPDIELMEAAKRGSLDAFAALVKRHQSSLLNFFRRLGAYTDAEDLVQETFVRVYRYRERYRPAARFTTFLYTIARHAWADRLRKTVRRQDFAERLEAEYGGRVDDSADGQGSRMDVRHAVGRLSEKLRIVIVLSVFQGLTYQEIGDVLDVPVGTVKSRVFLALRELKEMLDEPM